MNPLLLHIKQKSGFIHFGFLRTCDKSNRETYPVKVATALKGDGLDCVLDGEHLLELKDKMVKLVQRYKDDYLYITGLVESGVELKGSQTILSISIYRACWFVRIEGGPTTWLEEKYTYQRPLSANTKFLSKRA